MENKECPMVSCKGKLIEKERMGKRIRYICDKCECKVEEPIK
jgi:hypothetical protein